MYDNNMRIRINIREMRLATYTVLGIENAGTVLDGTSELLRALPYYLSVVRRLGVVRVV